MFGEDGRGSPGTEGSREWLLKRVGSGEPDYEPPGLAAFCERRPRRCTRPGSSLIPPVFVGSGRSARSGALSLPNSFLWGRGPTVGVRFGRPVLSRHDQKSPLPSRLSGILKPGRGLSPRTTPPHQSKHALRSLSPLCALGSTCAEKPGEALQRLLRERRPRQRILSGSEAQAPEPFPICEASADWSSTR